MATNRDGPTASGLDEKLIEEIATREKGISSTFENVGVGEALTFEEVERIHAETLGLDAREEKRHIAHDETPTVHDETPTGVTLSTTEVDKLIESLGTDLSASRSEHKAIEWLPQWATVPKEDESIEGRLTSLKNTLIDVESAVSAIRETTDNTEHAVGELQKDLTSMQENDVQEQFTEIHGQIKGLDRKLNQVITMLKLLIPMSPGGSPAVPSATPQLATAPAVYTKCPVRARPQSIV